MTSSSECGSITSTIVLQDSKLLHLETIRYLHTCSWCIFLKYLIKEKCYKAWTFFIFASVFNEFSKLNLCLPRLCSVDLETSQHLVILTRVFLLLIDCTLSLLQLFCGKNWGFKSRSYCQIICSKLLLLLLSFFILLHFYRQPKLAFPVIHVKVTVKKMVFCGFIWIDSSRRFSMCIQAIDSRFRVCPIKPNFI